MPTRAPRRAAFGTLALQVVMGGSVGMVRNLGLMVGPVRPAQPVLQAAPVLGAVISPWPVLRENLVIVEPKAAVTVLQGHFLA